MQQRYQVTIYTTAGRKYQFQTDQKPQNMYHGYNNVVPRLKQMVRKVLDQMQTDTAGVLYLSPDAIASVEWEDLAPPMTPELREKLERSERERRIREKLGKVSEMHPDQDIRRNFAGR